MVDSGGDDGGGEEATEDGADFLNMSTSVIWLFFFIGFCVFMAVFVCAGAGWAVASGLGSIGALTPM